METLKVIQEILIAITYYGGFVLTAFLLFRYQKNSLWWAFFGFMLVDSVATIWMHVLAKQGINNWHITDWSNVMVFTLIGWVLISVPNRTQFWTWAWGICSISLLVMVAVEDSNSHWSTQVENALQVIFAGAAILRYIQQDKIQRLFQVGVFWVVLAQFFLKSVQLIVLALYTLVHLPPDQLWSQLIMTVFNVIILIYMMLLMYGAWHFKSKALSKEG